MLSSVLKGVRIQILRLHFSYYTDETNQIQSFEIHVQILGRRSTGMILQNAFQMGKCRAFLPT